MDFLFQTDPYLRSFSATVTDCELTDQSGVWRVTLDRTAFFPGGGGQWCDRGTLNGMPVLKTEQPVEDGYIYHYVESEMPLMGQVHGELDWERRFDGMQQHTGQHLLSYAVYKRFNGYSLGLHVGEKDGYVDIQTDVKTLTPVDKAALEAVTDELIALDLPVKQYYPTKDELALLPFRKPPVEHPHLRVVHIGPECVACCGAHLGSSGQARMVKITGSVSSHGNLRIFFLAGQRAIDYVRACTLQAEEAAAALSCSTTELAQMVARLKDSQKEQAHLLAAYKRDEAVRALSAEQALAVNGKTYLIRLMDGLDMKQLQEAASAMLKTGISAVLLASSEPGKPGFGCVLGVDPSLLPDVNALFRRLAQAFGGKGGGRGDFAQGRLDAFDRAQAEQLIAQQLSL